MPHPHASGLAPTNTDQHPWAKSAKADAFARLGTLELLESVLGRFGNSIGLHDNLVRQRALTTMAHPFPRIEAAAIDGRLHTVYHRQVQLERLCKALVDNVNEIKQTIEQDYDYSPQEIATEYHQTLTAAKQYYALLDPKEAHEEEYLVANRKDASQTRAPAGIVYIEPTTHTFFYSSIVPLVAALAAGNCVVLLVRIHSFHT